MQKFFKNKVRAIAFILIGIATIYMAWGLVQKNSIVTTGCFTQLKRFNSGDFKIETCSISVDAANGSIAKSLLSVYSIEGELLTTQEFSHDSTESAEDSLTFSNEMIEYKTVSLSDGHGTGFLNIPPTFWQRFSARFL